MKKIQYISVLLLMVLAVVQLQAQQSRVYRKYATQKVLQRLQKESPEVYKQMVNIEQHVKVNQKKIQPKKVSIPIVFHVLYSGKNASVDENQIYAQIEALNRDFDREKEIKHEADTKEGFGDRSRKLGISFCLPKKGPLDNKKAHAVSFLPSARPQWEIDDAMKSSRTGGMDPWDTDAYLNVWVVDLANSWSGYAQMPGGPAATDGIVIDSKFFGLGTDRNPAPYQEGKTLTHLVASYLGLKELWNESSPCADDHVSDTPVHNSPNFTGYKYKHRSSCPGYPIEMTMNFMDNTDDEDMYMFTQGQRDRLLAMLNEDGPRYGLTQTQTACENIKIKNRDLLSSLPESKSSYESDLLRLFPNPAFTELNIQINSPSIEIDGTLLIYSNLGNLVYQEKLQVGKTTMNKAIDCSTWPAGVYFVHAHLSHQQFVQKLIVSKN